MAKVLILDDTVLLRELVAAALTAKGHAVRCANSATDALAAVRASRPDVVLLEPATGGKAIADGGLAFLRALRADPVLARVPVLVLAAAADRQHVTEAVALGVSDYVLKARSSVRDLLERVAKAGAAAAARPAPAPNNAPPAAAGPKMAPTPAPTPGALRAGAAAAATAPLLTREACLQRVDQALPAKTLAGVVAQVIGLAASPRTDLAQLAELIGRDVVLSARVLHAINSAAYTSGRGPIATIPQAVRQIGGSTVRNITAAVGVFDAMPATAADGSDPIRCWQHAFAVARLCEQLVAGQAPEQIGTAYLVGLCHDLGGILFRTHFGAEYGRVLDAHRASLKPLRLLERDMLGMTQEELTLAILGSLNLPQEVREPIESAHAAGDEEPRHPLARVLRLAELYANGVMLAAGGSAPVAPLTRADCKRATGRDAPLAPEAAALRAEIMAVTLMLARLDAGDERAQTQPPLPRRDLRLWLARDAGLSAFDPLAAALATFANLTVSERLPSSLEARDFAGLVIAARTPKAAGLDATAIAFAAAPADPAAPPLPVLWLTGHPADAMPPGVPTPPRIPRPWPISLDDLAEFAGACAPPAAHATLRARPAAA